MQGSTLAGGNGSGVSPERSLAKAGWAPGTCLEGPAPPCRDLRAAPLEKGDPSAGLGPAGLHPWKVFLASSTEEELQVEMPEGLPEGTEDHFQDWPQQD